MLDVNVLIALFDSAHAHHDAAHRWLLAVGLPSFATCPLTENGFVRIVSNPAYPTARLSAADALAALKAFCMLPGHVFWPDSISLSDGSLFDPARLRGHQQITDLYLAGLAHRNGGKLASFDNRIPIAALVGALPITENPIDLTSARPGEGDRPWSAGAGSGALAVGLTETVWILDRIRSSLTRDVPVFLRWKPFQAAGVGLFIWEAFVTKEAKADTHHGDAELAVRCFRDSLPNPEGVNAVTSNNVRSLIGAALLQTGWTGDLSHLQKPCLVIRVKPTVRS